MTHKASNWLDTIVSFLGIPSSTPHRSEQWVAAVGALLSIATVVLITHSLLGQRAAVVVVPSLGATAVLVFAAPHSVFAQPWAVLTGNLLSALVGVLCYRWLPNPTLAAAIAVALAIAVMHAARCIHPPGGAAALAAVIGGPDIHELGYAYALFPVGLNCLILLSVGIAFNYIFAWRRYPASLMRYRHVDTLHAVTTTHLSETHVRQAMEQLKVVIDVSPTELKEVIDQSLALAQRSRDGRRPAVNVGRFYGSDRPGRHWSVRQVVEERASDDPAHDLIIYKVVEGKGRNRHGSCTRAEFLRWAGRELHPRHTTKSR